MSKLPADLYDYIRRDPNNIKHVLYPSEELQLLAVSLKNRSVMHIMNPTERVQMVVADKHTPDIMFIHNMLESVQLYVMTLGVNYIAYITNPTPKVALMAVKQYGRFLCHIRPSSQTEEVILEAVRNDPDAKRYIDVPISENLLAELTILELAKK